VRAAISRPAWCELALFIFYSFHRLHSDSKRVNDIGIGHPIFICPFRVDAPSASGRTRTIIEDGHMSQAVMAPVICWSFSSLDVEIYYAVPAMCWSRAPWALLGGLAHAPRRRVRC
jgi:hypothetical protein